ncbi:MAG: CotH kinase family protein [Bryobacteraceae bacterium]
MKPLLFTTLLAMGALNSHAQMVPTDVAAAFFDDSEVREIRLYFEDANWYQTLLQAHSSDPEDPYFPCRFQSGGVSLEKIGCRFKGNSSFRRNGIKKPFKLDFNEYDDNATFMGLKKLNINNFDLQPDFMREKLLHDLAGKYVAALRSVYVRLYVNDAFYGLYLAVEQPDKTMMQSRWGKDEDGNLYEAEEQMGGGRPNLGWLGAEQSAYENVYLLKTNEDENDFSHLIGFLDILNNAPADELPARIETIADVENWLQGMAVNNLVVNLDSYLGVAAEYYLYDRGSDGKFVHIQWDNNESFGITGDGTPRLASPGSTDPFWLPTTATNGPGGARPGPGGGAASSNARPLLERLWAVPEYKRLYLRALARMLRGGFNPEAMRERVDQLAGMIRGHVAEDPNKPYTTDQFDTALNTQVSNIPGIRQFVQERYGFLRSYLDAEAQPADVRINEIAGAGAVDIRDEAGDGDAWVEIYNVGPGPVSLSGFTLTDDAANPSKWSLPPRTLADGESLIVWLDGETGEGASHASFTKPDAGGKLYLFANGERIDTATVEATPAGQTQARQRLYGTYWTVTTDPTPGAENRIVAPVDEAPGPTGRLLVNELMASNEASFQDPDEPGAFEDWFEIYNPGQEAVDMSGMYITDNPDNPTKWQVPEGVSIPAGAHLVFIADGETAQGARHTSFSLSASGESLSIYAADGATLIDTVTFGAQTADVSYGRPEGAAQTFATLAVPTPGAPNSGAR